MADGEIQPTFRWQQQLAGAHAGSRDYNEHGIGICLIGNFDEQAPTDRQLAAVGELDSLVGQTVFDLARPRRAPSGRAGHALSWPVVSGRPGTALAYSESEGT